MPAPQITTRSISTKCFPKPVPTRRRLPSPFVISGSCFAATHSSRSRSSTKARNDFCLCLDQLLLYSEDYAKELGERLKERIFEDIFPHLAAGFIAFIRQRDGLHADISQDTLNTVYQGTLTLLYRLLFLLYAESRDLLPVKEVRGYFEASLTKLKQEIAEAAGNIEDEVEEKLKKHYRDDSLRALRSTMPALPDYRQRRFRAERPRLQRRPLSFGAREETDDSPEADAARFLNQTKVPDRFLALAVDLLARDEDQKRHDLVFIDFKSLGVRQLGSIYEGLIGVQTADRRTQAWHRQRKRA